MQIKDKISSKDNFITVNFDDAEDLIEFDFKDCIDSPSIMKCSINKKKFYDLLDVWFSKDFIPTENVSEYIKFNDFKK